MLLTEFMSSEDKTCGKGKKIEENTYLGSMKDDPHMMHHYFTEEEIRNLFSRFFNTKISPTTYFNEIEAFDVEAIK